MCFLPHQGQLVLHQRMVDDVDFAGHVVPFVSVVRTRCRRCAPAAAARRPGAARRPARGRPARSRPRAPSPAAGVGVEPQTGAQRRRHAIQQRHRERPPLDHHRRADVVHLGQQRRRPRHQQATVQEQPAVAVLGQTGERIQLGHHQPGRGQRLEQRVAEPLRQLVQRHQPQLRVAPGVAQVHPVQGLPARPDRPQQLQHRRQDLRRRHDSAALRAQPIGQHAHPGDVPTPVQSRRARPAPRPAGASAPPAPPAPPAGCRPTPGKTGPAAASSTAASPSASARSGAVPGALEKPPARNMCKLASASPSERPSTSPVSASR